MDTKFISRCIDNGKRVLACFHCFDQLREFPHATIEISNDRVSMHVRGNAYIYNHRSVHLDEGDYTWSVLQRYGTYHICVATRAAPSILSPVTSSLYDELVAELSMWCLAQPRTSSLYDMVTRRYWAICQKTGVDLITARRYAVNVINDSFTRYADEEKQFVEVPLAWQADNVVPVEYEYLSPFQRTWRWFIYFVILPFMTLRWFFGVPAYACDWVRDGIPRFYHYTVAVSMDAWRKMRRVS